MTPKPWTPPGEGWIEHRPGDACPVDPIQRVEILFRWVRETQAESYSPPVDQASFLGWGYFMGKGHEIVAYRIVKSREQLEAEIATLREALREIAMAGITGDE